ncbi:MAG: MCE family protein [Gemmatimonadales bacterium]|nr:MCE family protein [Gemmatimonadales bacterium]
MDLHYKREATVGTLVVLGFIVFIAAGMWLQGHDFSSSDRVRIQFADVGNLKEASPVKVAGVVVGKVQKIELINRNHVLVTASVPERVAPRTDASATIVALSLTGDAGVDLEPGVAPTPLPKGTIIIGHQDKGLGDIAASLSGRADTLLTNLQQLVDTQMIRQLRATAAAAQGTLQAAQRTMALYGDPNKGPTAELTRTMVAYRRLGARLDSTLANPAFRRALDRSDSLSANLTSMTAQFARTGAHMDSILYMVQHGNGTLGKLATDSTLYQNVASLTASLDSILVQIKKNPGKIQLTVPVKIF